MKWIRAVPELPVCGRIAKGDAMKGRAVTGEELWKMLMAASKVVGPKNAKHWRRLLVGLLRVVGAADRRSGQSAMGWRLRNGRFVSI